MFRIDLTTARTAPFTKLVWPDCEDFEALQVVGDAPTWLLDVSAPEDGSMTPTARCYLFRDLLQALHVGLGEGWTARALHMLSSSPTESSREPVVTRVNQRWECEDRLGQGRFEVVTATGTRYVGLTGEFVYRPAKRQLQMWPTLSLASRAA